MLYCRLHSMNMLYCNSGSILLLDNLALLLLLLLLLRLLLLLPLLPQPMPCFWCESSVNSRLTCQVGRATPDNCAQAAQAALQLLPLLMLAATAPCSGHCTHTLTLACCCCCCWWTMGAKRESWALHATYPLFPFHVNTVLIIIALPVIWVLR